MRIAITGSNGFIGKALVEELLRQKHAVCVLMSQPQQVVIPEVKTLHYRTIVADCETALKNWQPDVFFHLAWRGVNNEQRNNEENIQYNIQLTYDTVELAYKTGCRQWIGCGSQAEYGIKNHCITEASICNPVSGYGKAKQLLCVKTEKLCRKYDLDFTWARIFSVYGPGDHSTTFVSYLFNAMLQKRVPQVSSCSQLWDYLFITDAAKALASLVDKNGIYNIASGNVVELKQVVEHIAALTNYNWPISWNSKPDGVLQQLHGSIEKITTTTGWQPTVMLGEGLHKTLNYYLQL